MHHGACLMNVGVARRLHGTAAVLPGVRTGECVTSIDHPPNKTCEIYGWCPVEQDALPLYEFTLIVCYRFSRHFANLVHVRCRISCNLTYFTNGMMTLFLAKRLLSENYVVNCRLSSQIAVICTALQIIRSKKLLIKFT